MARERQKLLLLHSLQNQHSYLYFRQILHQRIGCFSQNEMNVSVIKVGCFQWHQSRRRIIPSSIFTGTLKGPPKDPMGARQKNRAHWPHLSGPLEKLPDTLVATLTFGGLLGAAENVKRLWCSLTHACPNCHPYICHVSFNGRLAFLVFLSGTAMPTRQRCATDI